MSTQERHYTPKTHMTRYIYVMSWYPDGGAPDIRFFLADNAIGASRYVAKLSESVKKVEVGFVEEDEPRPDSGLTPGGVCR